MSRITKPLNIRYYSLEISSFKCQKELSFGNVVDIGLDISFDFMTIHSLQYTKTPNIKWLGEVRRVCRQTESDNIVVFAELLKLD